MLHGFQIILLEACLSFGVIVIVLRCSAGRSSCSLIWRVRELQVCMCAICQVHFYFPGNWKFHWKSKQYRTQGRNTFRICKCGKSTLYYWLRNGRRTLDRICRVHINPSHAYLVVVGYQPWFLCRKLEPLQQLKLLPAPVDDSSKKLIRGVSSSRILNISFDFFRNLIRCFKEICLKRTGSWISWVLSLIRVPPET